MNFTYTIKGFKGITHTSSRLYTHAVVARYDWDKAIQKAETITDSDIADYHWFKQLSLAKVGDVLYRSPNVELCVEQKDIDCGVNSLLGCNDKSAWIRKLKSERLTKVIFDMECSGEHTMHAVRWASREDLAINAKAEFVATHKDIQVVEVNRVTNVH